MGVGYATQLYLHLDGDNVTELMALNSTSTSEVKRRYDLSVSDFCYVDNVGEHYNFARDGNLYTYFSDVGMIIMYITPDAIFDCFLNRALQNGKGGKTVPEIIYNGSTFDTDTEYFQEWWALNHLDELFIKKPVACSIFNDSKRVDFVPAIQKVYKFLQDRVAYHVVMMTISDDAKKMFHSDRNNVTINLPVINQISDYADEKPENMPAGLRAVVITDTPQYSVNSTYRGRQSYNISPVRSLLQNLSDSVTSRVLDFYLVNDYNVKTTIGFRIDLGDGNPDKMVMYTKGRKEAPLYMTLRFPPELLTVSQIIPSTRGGNEYTYNEEEFESNVIITNAGMAALMIGGGMMSGIGQGIGGYAQTRVQQDMQNKYLDWAEDKQQRDFLFRRSMQGDMFDWQSSQLDKNLNFQKETQIRNIGMQSDLQYQAFEQQNAYQQRQNEFTRSLVETNLDSDIRRARNAQQLAGYRTDATVSNLSIGAGRGGFGHPLAPQGAPLPPRTVSTQTSTPKVNLTQPSGYYSGPLESVI